MKSRAFALVLVYIMVFITAAPGLIAEGMESEKTDTIVIRTADDLVEFADNCKLDTWSRGKLVVLKADISLSGTDFKSIPTFGGTFRGNDHTISGLEITDKLNPAGLFGYLQPGAEVSNLNVLGTVAPAGDANMVGGIVGENNGTIESCTFIGDIEGVSNVGGIAGINNGTIYKCSSKGTLLGEKMAGGIVGYNTGDILFCENRAKVNTVSVDPVLHPDEINVDFSGDISKLTTLDTSTAASDTGGIAGYSSGTIVSCKNIASVGYSHTGYNIGGIVGRNCGFVNLCENKAVICGRKDVGGIVGQIEPNIVLILSADHIGTLSQQIDHLGKLVDDAGENAGAAGGAIQSHIGDIASYEHSAITALEDMIDQLAAGEPPAQTSLDSLIASVNGMYASTNTLMEAVGNSTGAMSDDANAISSQIGAISETLSLAVEEAETAEVVTDSSDSNLETITHGKVLGCINYAAVQADLNVGGIVGVMGLENTLDPEDDMSTDVSGSQKKKYELKAIVQSCKNAAMITAKYDYVGGICGRMDLGLIVSSQGYGKIASENGDYVGGIAGLAGGTVKDSFAKCTLTGGRYIGGIVGCGVNEDVGGDASLVSGCFSMVEIPQYEQYIGAVSGERAGNFAGNYFVSDVLAGINRVSYLAIAEPITYDELLFTEGLPQEFRKLTLTFIADGITIKTVDFDFGESFEEDVYPDIPQKEGYYAEWDIKELSVLKFDTVVTAEYIPLSIELHSQQRRDDGREVFFIQGQFTAQDSMTAELQISDSNDFDIFAESLPDGIQRAFSVGMIGRDIEEQWAISFSDDGADSHYVRYLPPDGNPENIHVYVRGSEGWNRVRTETIGSYISFELDDTEAEIAFISVIELGWVWIAAVIAVLLPILLIVRTICKLAKKKRDKRNGKA